MTIKVAEASDPTCEALLVVQGHKDLEKDALIHESTNIRQSSICLLFGIAAGFGFNLWSTDVSQAYLQSRVKLLRGLYVQQAIKSIFPQGALPKLLRPLHELQDAVYYWNTTFWTICAKILV